jgi:Arc/MetJ-type ribon-helix-helix transcriptional regulator
MTGEEEGTIQVNVRLYKNQVKELDKWVEDSKFKNRSEYLRNLIDTQLDIEQAREDMFRELDKAESILNNFRKVKNELKLLFDESKLDENLKKGVMEVLNKED